MPELQSELVTVFKRFVEAVLLEDNAPKALEMMADDVVGLGMGDQGVVHCKADAARILGAGKADAEPVTKEIEYGDILTRCFEGRYGFVCGVIKVKTTTAGKTVLSVIGQMVNLRKENGRWLVYALQATPMFEQLEEMEAYPLKFAEDVLEKYRRQEQIAQQAQSDSLAIYVIDFTKGVFEESVLKSDVLVRTEPGQPYEQVMFNAAKNYLDDEGSYQFISTFSIGNVHKTYDQGQTELSVDYQMAVPGGEALWMRSTLRLYTDKVEKSLKGYLYVTDIDGEKRRELDLYRRAERDPLSGLYRRDAVERLVSERLKLPAQTGAFMMIDLDYFKRVNDTYGHQEGDRVIREAAQCLQVLVREGDLTGRFGGDEFCVFLQGALTRETIRERVSALCEQIRAICPGGGKSATCSVGIAFASDPDMTFEELYRRADRALYWRKNHGRDGYAVYGEETSHSEGE